MFPFKKKAKYPRVCIVCTVFSLFEYLLYSSYEEIKNTYFIFEDWLYKDFGEKFDNSFRMPAWGTGFFWNPNLIWIRWYYIKWFKLPNLKGSELFTLDHLSYHAVFIGKHKYTLLEDAPYCHSIMYNKNVNFSSIREKWYEHHPSLIQRLLFRFRKKVYGPVYFNRWGKNDLCSDLILSTDDYLDYFSKKNMHRMNFKGLWDTFTNQKKDFILNVFDMTLDDVNVLMSKNIIILTMPFYPDYLSYEEHEHIWKQIISKYPKSDVLVKPHPRDNYRYEENISGISVFGKKIPTQFLEVLDLSFNKAVTAYSTAVFGVNVKEIDWYGTQVSKKLYDIIGDYSPTLNRTKVNYCTL